jgi:hypothetical protein
MRRLLSPSVIDIPVGGGLAPLCPRRFFDFSPLCPIMGLGRCRSSAPARFFGGKPR